MDETERRVTAALYIFGFLDGLIFWPGVLVGLVKLRGWWRNFPHWRKRVIIVAPHPYKGEQFLLTALSFWQYLFKPNEYGPYTAADTHNYYRHWLYRFLQPRLIPVDRELKKGDLASMDVGREILASGGNIICFPGGGRESKAKIFRTSKEKGKKLRALKSGFLTLATEPDVSVLPIWVEFSRFRMRITIGELMKFTPGTPRNEIVERTEETLLRLADETN